MKHPRPACEDPRPRVERILVVPGDRVVNVFDQGSPVQVPLRTVLGYAEFAAAMQPLSDIPVELHTGPGLPVIDGHALLVALPYLIEDLRAASGVTDPMAYVAIIDAPSSKITKLLATKPAVLVDSRSYESWRHHSDAPVTLLGHRWVSDRIGAATTSRLMREECAYALTHGDGLDLPTLLSAYLSIYNTAINQDNRGAPS